MPRDCRLGQHAASYQIIFWTHRGEYGAREGRDRTMVAPRRTRRVVCTVIRVPENESLESEFQKRPSNRLPWSDPVIARLVTTLQDEIRLERRQAKLAWRATSYPTADLDPPSPMLEDDGDWADEPRWTWPD